MRRPQERAHRIRPRTCAERHDQAGAGLGRFMKRALGAEQNRNTGRKRVQRRLREANVASWPHKQIGDRKCRARVGEAKVAAETARTSPA